MSYKNRRLTPEVRARFDKIYDSSVVGAGFFESDEYYKRDKERYWRSLHFLCNMDIPSPARILEIGGGQMALLCSQLFDDECVVGDISETFAAPLLKFGVRHVRLNLMQESIDETIGQFDVILLLEVIEHIPLPAYVIFDRLKIVLKPHGVLFLTTPNLFRIRNLFRMILGIEFLDRFMLPRPAQGLGHQLEYSADHLTWQITEAKMELVLLAHDELGRVGHSRRARIARRLLSPLRMRPLWRDGLVAAARKKD